MAVVREVGSGSGAKGLGARVGAAKAAWVQEAVRMVVLSWQRMASAIVRCPSAPAKFLPKTVWAAGGTQGTGWGAGRPACDVTRALTARWLWGWSACTHHKAANAQDASQNNYARVPPLHSDVLIHLNLHGSVVLCKCCRALLCSRRRWPCRRHRSVSISHVASRKPFGACGYHPHGHLVACLQGELGEL